VPRLLSVQAAGAAPFARAFREGFAERRRVKAETVATAIKIGDPASWDRARRALADTNGMAVDVSDDEILEAKAAVDAAGVGCEPASAASVAGVRRLVREGTIAPDARVVCVLTGHVLKDPGALIDYHAAGSARAAREPAGRGGRVARRDRPRGRRRGPVSGVSEARVREGGVREGGVREGACATGRARGARARPVLHEQPRRGVRLRRRRARPVARRVGARRRRAGRHDRARRHARGARRLPDGRRLVTVGFGLACARRGVPVPDALAFTMTSEIPVARGLGSSAVSLVAGIMLANEALALGLTQAEVLGVGSDFEGAPGQRRADGARRRGAGRAHAERLGVDAARRARFVRHRARIPDFETSTREMRAALPDTLPRRDAVLAAGKSAALVRGLATGDPGMLAHALDDVLHVPYRRALVRGYDEVVAAALAAGAFGATLSGSGSTVLALAPRELAAAAAAAMCDAWAALGVRAEPAVARLAGGAAVTTQELTSQQRGASRRSALL
jgi:homoserine kinase